MKRSFEPEGKSAGRHDGLPAIPGNNSSMTLHPPGNGMIPHSAAPGNGVLAAALASAHGNRSLTTASSTGNGIMTAVSSSGNRILSTCAPPENGIMATSSSVAGNGVTSAGTDSLASLTAAAALMARTTAGNSMTHSSPPLDIAGPSSGGPMEGMHGSGVSSTSASTSPTGDACMVDPLVTKDDAYWEKRRKNNESAKRSREARRQKESAVAFRALQLERENYVLETQLRYLQADVDQLERQALSVAKPSQSKAVMYANNLNAVQDFDNCQYDLNSHSSYQGPPPPPPPGSTV